MKTVNKELLSLEKVFELLGVTELPGDMELLRRFTTKEVEEKGEEHVRKYRRLYVDQWLSF